MASLLASLLVRARKLDLLCMHAMLDGPMGGPAMHYWSQVVDAPLYASAHDSSFLSIEQKNKKDIKIQLVLQWVFCMSFKMTKVKLLF